MDRIFKDLYLWEVPSLIFFFLCSFSNILLKVVLQHLWQDKMLVNRILPRFWRGLCFKYRFVVILLEIVRLESRRDDGEEVVLSWINEGLYFIYHFLLLGRGLFSDPLSKELDPLRPNIVLVYGFFGRPSVFIPFREKLEGAGFNVLVPDLGWAFNQDLDKLAERLEKYLLSRKKILLDNYKKDLPDLPALVFFGYSMGALIILVCQRLNKAFLDITVVSVGSPLRGSPWAYLALPGISKDDLRPGSQWLEDLWTHVKDNPRKLIQVRAAGDEVVPYTYSSFPGYPLYTFPIVGHVALLYEFMPKYLIELLNS